MPDAGMKGQFDADALRRKVSDLPAGDTEDAPSVLNPFALQIASQFRDENTSPSLLIGQIRLLEFLSLLALGLLAMVTLTAPDNAGLPTHFAIALLGALVSVIAMQAADTYQIPLLRIAARARRRVVVAWLIGFAASAAANPPSSWSGRWNSSRTTTSASAASSTTAARVAPRRW